MSLIKGFINIPRSVRHINRYREIVFVLIKYGLGDIIGNTKSISVGFFKRKRQGNSKAGIDLRKASTYEKIRLAIEELGPTFIKFGQIMSNRPDIFPEALIAELEKLQKNVAPFSFDLANKIIEEELCEKKNACFLEIDTKPLASASIAQVHKAILKNGEKVVLKIQRPNIAKLIETDIEIMQYLAKRIQRQLPELSGVDAPAIINEFRATIKRELDFYQEISNIERFQINFESDKDIYIPQIYKDLCTKNLIVLEFIEGLSVNDLISPENTEIDPRQIAKKGANIILKQIFTFGFFHADPHPGNILVLPDSRICFIDFGMTGSLPIKFRAYLADMILGFVNQDAEMIVKVLKKFTLDASKFDAEELELRISELVEEFTYLPLTKIDSTQVIHKLLALLVQFRLRLPPVVYMLLKALITIEGVARKLDDEFNISEYVKPFAKKLLKEKMDPFILAKNKYPKFIDFLRNLVEFPEIAFDISEMLRDGQLKIGIENKDTGPILENNRKNSQMLAYSILSAAIFIGSSIIIAFKTGPYWYGISVPGILGTCVAVIFAFAAILSGRRPK
jgi:ubiquinone biosynthesis protein